jgi:hypothetical protein
VTRTYESEGREIPPLTLGDMRRLATPVVASCVAQRCGNEAEGDVSALPDELAMPDVSLPLTCSACDGRQIKTVPAWHTNPGMTKAGQG